MTADQVKIKLGDRIERVHSKDLMSHPNNPRQHTHDQKQVMEGILSEVGVIEPLIVYRSNKRWPGKIVVINGHLRKDQVRMDWPVIFADLTDEQADLAIQAFDQVGQMAVVDAAEMRKLRDRIEFEDKTVRMMLDRAEEDQEEAAGDDTETRTPKADDKNNPVPEMDLRPYESYDALLVVFRKTHDWNYMVEHLGLRKVQATNDKRYKGKVGMERAIAAERIIAVIQEKELLEAEVNRLRRAAGLSLWTKRGAEAAPPPAPGPAEPDRPPVMSDEDELREMKKKMG